jgi:hypothetical protein
MVEELELEEKKKEFHDASVEIVRLIDSGNIDDARELYNLYNHLYYELLPLLDEEEVSNYYENLNNIYIKLKPYIVTEEEVSGESKMYKTDIDTLYEWVQETGELPLTDIQEKFKIDKKKAEEWSSILEEGGLVMIKYDIFKGAILKKIK